MLYITTRNNKDAYTVHRTLTENFAVDGGGYVPFQMPVLDSCELESFASKSFGESVATILNLFFTPKMTGWDVEFSIGRNPIKLLSLNGKITVAELFSNPEGNYSYFVKALYDHILQNNSRAVHPTVWAEISIRIATLFGVWSEILKQGVISSQDLIDISLSANDYHTYIAAVYARKLGLPIGTMILSCDEGDPLWDLISRGEAKADIFGMGESATIERLLEATLGRPESLRYLVCREEKKHYSLTEEDYMALKSDFFAATVGNTRIASTAGNIAKRDGHSLNRNVAQAYAGVEDFRARCGIGRHALLIAESGK